MWIHIQIIAYDLTVKEYALEVCVCVLENEYFLIVKESFAYSKSVFCIRKLFRTS